MIPLLHWINHVIGADYGLPYGHWSFYNVYSGIGGSVLLNLLAFLAVFWWRHTCHDSWHCLRWGKYPVAGGLFATCWRHHPDSDGKRRPHRDLMHRMHREWREAAT